MFFCLKNFFTFTNSEDSEEMKHTSVQRFFTFTNIVMPDEMQHNAAFHLGLHCLQKYSFMGFQKTKG